MINCEEQAKNLWTSNLQKAMTKLSTSDKISSCKAHTKVNK